jgi:hypothetical protein
MKGAIDHLMWACSDLESGIATIESMTGKSPIPGGPHPGFGTRNALLDLANTTYLEIIAPDPEQSLEGNRGEEFAALDAPYLRTWAIRVEDLLASRDLLKSLGFEPRGPSAMSRALPSGELISWELLFLSERNFAGATLPFFIDWKGSAHPCTSLEPGCELTRLRIETPQADAIERLVAAFELDVEVVVGSDDRLEGLLSTPLGDVSLL